MDGEMVDWDKAQIHVMTHTLHYGMGVFEGIRAYELKDGSTAIFRLKEHIDRLFKSAHIMTIKIPFNREALMQAANDVTMAAYRHVHTNIDKNMLPSDISSLMNDATSVLGGQPQFASVLLNEASAYPHGTGQTQYLRDGGLILMDCGCAVHDYESDISRTWVFGEPNARQRKVWGTVKRGQEMALETATVGTPAGKVDDVVRAFYASEGFGPDYQTPGLSHRLGHGIGMDGHEPVNFVRGEKTPLAPGMCFSNEPGIYIFGEFGVRLEDCLYITDDGPQLFSELSPSIDKPFG